MARTNCASPATDLERAILDCRQRDYNLEGIPMYLVLEDLTADPARCGGSLVRTINFHNTIWAQAAEVERVDGAVREGDYRLVFSNTKIQRIPST